MIKDYELRQDILTWDVTKSGMGAPEVEPKKTSVVIECEDKCSAISLTKWDDEDSVEIFVYKSFCDGFWDRVKNAIRVLRGKNYLLADLVVRGDEINKIKSLF
jgi:hypothetical protein